MSPPDRGIDVESVAISWGIGKQDAQCKVWDVQRDHRSLAQALARLRNEHGPEAWFILAKFTDRRRQGHWMYSDGCALDFDYEDPLSGEHIEVPLDLHVQIYALAEAGKFGICIYYPTRRGIRLVYVFTRAADDEGVFRSYVTALREQAEAALHEAGVPLAEFGCCGFACDETSYRVNQPQRVPQDSGQIVTIGGDAIDVEQLLTSEVSRLDPRKVLTAEMAEPVLAVATGAEVAPEMVMLHLLALASACIGNKRRVARAGDRRGANLAAHQVVLQRSGAGKSHSWHAGGFQEVVELAEARVRERVREAEKEEHRYRMSVARWEREAKRAKGTDHPCPERPTGLHVDEAFVVRNFSTEALVRRCAESPWGFLLFSDEMFSVMAGIGRYTATDRAREGDAAIFRNLMDGVDTSQDRIGDRRRLARRPFMAIHLMGQPALVSVLYTDTDKVSGMASRFVVVSLPRERQRMDSTPPGHAVEQIKRRLIALLDVDSDKALDEQGLVVPSVLHLSADADRLFLQEWRQHIEPRLDEVAEVEAGWLSHARRRIQVHAALIALLEDPWANAVSANHMERSIILFRWTHDHFRSLVVAGSSALQAMRGTLRRHSDVLGDWMLRRLRRGEEIRLSDIQAGPRPFRGRAGRDRAIACLRHLGAKKVIEDAEGRPLRAARWEIPDPQGGASPLSRPIAPTFGASINKEM